MILQDASTFSLPKRLYLFDIPQIYTPGPEYTLGNQTKESQHVVFVDRRSVTNAIAKVSNQLGAIAIYMLGVSRGRHARVLLGKRDTEDVGPLLERFTSTLRAHQRICIPVPDLHAGALARVSRVRVAHEVAPLGGRVLQALGAGLVGAEGGRGLCGAGEAGVGDARVGGAGLEDVRVGAGHQVGHHGARGRAHDEDLGWVRRVLGQRVVDHADDAERVAARAVREAGGVLDVPAVAVVGGSRVDEDEAALVGVRGESGA